MLLRRFEKQLDVDMEKSASDSGFLKFTGYDIVFQEVPGEVSLALNLSRCPFRCPACHSPYLRENVGEVLDEKALSALLEKYGRTVTCVCFMGGDADPEAVTRLAAFVHRDYPGLKTAWYSGFLHILAIDNANILVYNQSVPRREPESGGNSFAGCYNKSQRNEIGMMKQMSKTLKAGAALLMAGSLVFAVTGCSDTTWGAECDGVRMPAGVYINNVISAYSTAVGELTEDADTDNIWKNTLDGVDLHTWVQNKALENVRNYFAVEQKFDEMGLTMDEETLSQAQSLAQYQWSYYQSSYEKNGVSEQSFTETIVNSYKNSMIFNAIYGEGGTQEVSDQELLDRFNEQYASIDRIYIPLAGEDGNTTQESIDAAREKAEGYQQRMENGESIADLAKEYANEQAVANGEETSDDPVNTSSLISYETSG